MCLALPGEVVAVDQEWADVSVRGRLRRVSRLLVPDIAVGEWALVAVDMIVARTGPDEASERADLFDLLLGAARDALESSD